MHNNKWYLTTSAIIFAVLAIAHLGRIIMDLPATVGTYEVPLWVSGAAVIIAGYLATRGLLAAVKL